MDDKQQFDFWYAVNNTELVTTPSSRLETFGDTLVNYHLISELMDSVDKVCVREGHLKALKPEIITPQALGHMDLEDFGPDAEQYADWLAEHGGDLKILQYGFRIQKREVKEYVVSEHIDSVKDKVKAEVEAKKDPLSSILIGVDYPWEVCLLKLMVELVQASAQGNMNDIRRQAATRHQDLIERIDRGFLEASRDSSRINALAELLKKNGLWEAYEDRFFALVKASRNQS